MVSIRADIVRMEGKRTRHGGPSGSPISMTVCSCLDRDEPSSFHSFCVNFLVARASSSLASILGPTHSAMMVASGAAYSTALEVGCLSTARHCLKHTPLI